VLGLGSMGWKTYCAAMSLPDNMPVMLTKLRLRWLIVVTSLPACQVSVEHQTLTPEATGGSSSYGQTCQAFELCQCDDGRLGQTTCDSNGQSSCGCDSCSQFAADLLRSLPDPCGGDPVGVWRLRTIVGDGYNVDILKKDAKVAAAYNKVANCPTKLINVSDPLDYTLELRSGGSAASAGTDPTITRAFSAACLGLSLPTSFSCATYYSGSTAACTGSCGLCTCNASAGTAVPTAWSYTGSILTLRGASSGDSVSTSYSYCVGTNQLTLYTTSSQLVFDKVYQGGTPAACSSRTTSNCAGAGCSLGACVGVAGCSATVTQSACKSIAGCTWDASVCGGAATSTCALPDYNKVPGCVLYASNAKCSGTASPCSSFSSADCASVAGCSLKTGCTGDVSLTCQQILQTYNICDCDVGCCSSSSTCAGNFGCSQPAQFQCKYGCTWVTNACVGTVPNCSTLSLDKCASRPGCSIVPQ
jgi:hypothetical protein